MKPDWQDKIIVFLGQQQLPATAKVYLIGSRARKDNNSMADIDLAFDDCPGFNVASLDEAIDALNIPLKIDLVNLDQTSKEFYNKAKAEGILIFERSAN